MTSLSPRTRERLEVLFAPGDVSAAEQLLTVECGETVAGPRASDEALERLRFAAMRLSGGTLPGLRSALKLAGEDWRDLLMAAGFGYDVEAHLQWRPQRFTAVEAANWRRGMALENVQFGPGATVEVLMGRFKQQRGAVVELLGLEPEPSFRVRLARGRDAEVRQSGLRAK